MRVAPFAVAACLVLCSTTHGVAGFSPPHAFVAHRSSIQRNKQRVSRLFLEFEKINLDEEASIEGNNADAEQESFVNNGPLAWMQMYLDLFGVQEGKSVFFGPIPVEVDESQRLSTDDARQRRQQAAVDLTNINMDERQRRDKAGNVMWIASAVYIAWASLIADDGGFSGHVLRFCSVVPTFLAVGYKLSAKTGL